MAARTSWPTQAWKSEVGAPALGRGRLGATSSTGGAAEADAEAATAAGVFPDRQALRLPAASTAATGTSARRRQGTSLITDGKHRQMKDHLTAQSVIDRSARG
ncbi:hypothetical protein Areg01_41370 [Actinoplanes regularis]|nr:hypothetical protein Areg01_41370 [Actinoplanes regularis]